MNTPAHLIFGFAFFGKPGAPRVTAAAVFGALLPDLSLYILAGTSILVLGIPADRVFNELYFSVPWQTMFAIDNSAFLWGGALVAGIWLRRPAMTAFAAAGLLHLLTDFLLHHDDGRAHFWPVSTWVFQSPLSYWDSAHHAGVIAPLEGGLSAALTASIFWRFRLWWVRGAALGFLALELWVIRQWLIHF